MAPFAEAVAAQRHELLHHRQHRIADALGLGFELCEIDLGDIAVLDDLVCRLLRDDAEPRLRPRQRRLEVEIFLHAVVVGKHPPHRLGGEDVAEYGGVDQRRGHGRNSPGSVASSACGDAPLPWGNDRSNRCRSSQTGSRSAALAGHCGGRIPALFRRGNGTAAACDRGFARRSGSRPSRILRRQPLWLRGAMADRLAGDHRGGQRAHARRAGRDVRAARQSRADGAADCRSGGGRVGRRLVGRRRRCDLGEAWSARGQGRRHRPDDVRAAWHACGKIRRDRQSQPPLYTAAPGQVGGGNRLDADRRRLDRSRHDGRCATACGQA